MKDNKMLADILGVSGNDRCCDCSAENPEWASINLGITLCIGMCNSTTLILEYLKITSAVSSFVVK